MTFIRKKRSIRMATLTGKQIQEAALACGFDGCGIIPLSELAGYEDRIAEREEKIPMSAMVYDHLKRLAHPEQEHPWAKATVVMITWVGKYKFPDALKGRYAKEFLLSQETLPEGNRGKKRFEDWMTEQGIRWAGGAQDASSVIPLRYAAVQAGLGIFRQNNFFYGPKGSWYEIDGYLIDQDAVYKETSELKPCSPKCTICRKACPTGALCDVYTMNPLHCVSFMNTFGDGHPIPPTTLEQAGEWICGCDACQDACPHNRRHDWSEGEEFPGLSDITELLAPENILTASDEELREKVIPKSANHLRDDQTDLLRRMARNCLEQQEKEMA